MKKFISVLMTLILMTLTILTPFAVNASSLGDSNDFIIKNGILTSYKGNGGNITIPDGVTKIGEKVFFTNREITGVTIPGSVIEIEASAFSGCVNLTKINIAFGLEIIGEYAFAQCSFRIIELPNSVTTIKDWAFHACIALTDIVIPPSVTSIGKSVFYGVFYNNYIRVTIYGQKDSFAHTYQKRNSTLGRDFYDKTSKGSGFDWVEFDQFIEAPENTANTGNTSGNISNGGNVAFSGNNIYYASNGKLMVTGNKQATITNNVTMYNYAGINVVGDWIYYVGKDGICKIKTDGTNEKLLESKIIPRYLVVVDEWIYYVRNDFLEKEKGIYKMRTDGTEKKRVSQEVSYDINVIGDWIYYRNSARNLCKVRTDGTDLSIVCSGKCLYFVYDDGWLYYSNCDDNDKLYKMKQDGTSVIKLSDDKVVGYINVTNGKVIYNANKEATYSIDTDGKNKTKILNKGYGQYYTYGNLLYFFDNDELYYIELK